MRARELRISGIMWALCNTHFTFDEENEVNAISACFLCLPREVRLEVFFKCRALLPIIIGDRRENRCIIRASRATAEKEAIYIS